MACRTVEARITWRPSLASSGSGAGQQPLHVPCSWPPSSDLRRWRNPAFLVIYPILGGRNKMEYYRYIIMEHTLCILYIHWFKKKQMIETHSSVNNQLHSRPWHPGVICPTEIWHFCWWWQHQSHWSWRSLAQCRGPWHQMVPYLT